MSLTDKQKKAKRQAKAFFFADTKAMAAALNAEGGAEAALTPRSNVVGVGIGPKVVNGSVIVADEAVRVLVRVKIPRDQLTHDETVPEEFNKLPTDVVEVGDVTALALLKSWQRFGRHRPTSCGVSVGHKNITAGTLGCVVERDGDHYILSNNHVLADSNKGIVGVDEIIQPGRLDGGSAPGDKIADLTDFEPLDFSGNDNEIDAAIAKIGTSGQKKVERDIIDIGKPQQLIKPAATYQSVRKHGRTTGHTIGVVTTVSTDLWVGYGVGQKAWFVDQIEIIGVGGKDFSQGGDSGSLIVDAVTLEPVGLLFAGGKSQTFANPIDKALNRFGVTIA